MGLARMNGQVGFAELLAALEGRGLPGKGASDIFRVHEEEQFFVPPEFLVKEDLGDLTGPVLLLSARGAAGKSRTAEELSRILGAPLWKLERDKAVGSTSLPFTIGGYLGVADPYAALERFDRPTVLIDSLDEARARVSGTSWAEFLESLSEATRLGCHLVLLGRERTLEEAWLQLSDVGTMPAWLEISHFGPAERVTYVDGVVLQWSRKGSATTGPYYRAARDAVLNSLAGSVPGPCQRDLRRLRSSSRRSRGGPAAGGQPLRGVERLRCRQRQHAPPCGVAAHSGRSLGSGPAEDANVGGGTSARPGVRLRPGRAD